MSESITLPRSGIVLPRHPSTHPRWQLRTGDHEFIVEEVFIDGTRWLSMQCFVAPTSERYCTSTLGTRDECIAWLDARVLAFRSALLPPDAVERVARALLDAHRSRYAVSVGIPDRTVEDATVYAKAVLAALGVDHA